ncbi:MAG TPA: cyclodeaminase/cyclohydrolase family protein [Solirubrobacteraceae bacterium]
MLAEQSIDRLLEQIAARTPAPGGGSAAGLAVAIAAALEQMAAGFTLGREEYAAHHRRAQALRQTAAELRARALDLAERELHSYGDLLAARRLPEGEPGRERRVSDAADEAIAAPLELCGCAAAAAELGAELARDGNRNLAGDAICATLLAEAACRAAATLVQINIGPAPDDPRALQAGALADRALDARRRALS